MEVHWMWLKKISMKENITISCRYILGCMNFKSSRVSLLTVNVTDKYDLLKTVSRRMRIIYILPMNEECLLSVNILHSTRNFISFQSWIIVKFIRHFFLILGPVYITKWNENFTTVYVIVVRNSLLISIQNDVVSCPCSWFIIYFVWAVLLDRTRPYSRYVDFEEGQ